LDALEHLEAEYQKKKRQIRADGSLSWEKKELSIKRLGLEFYKQRKSLEEELWSENLMDVEYT
jgi:hypothetical protein